MSLLGASQLRFLVRTPWSTLTVLLGIALGVASVVAVHLISLRVTDSLAAATPPHLNGLSHVLEVESGATTADAYFTLRARWRHGAVPQARALLPIVEGELLFAGRRTLVFAADWLAAGELPGGLGVAPGVLPGLDAIVVDADMGLAVGDVVSLGGRDYTIAGTVAAGLGPALFADIGAGQALLGLDPDTLSYVGMFRDDGFERLKDIVASMLPGITAGFDVSLGTPRVEGWRVRPIEAEQPTLAFARSVIFNLGALGSLALVVAWLLIYQVGVIWHRRRRTFMDRLFAMGVSQGELTRGFVTVFGMLGAVATLLGLFTGVLLARALSGISTAGLEVPGAIPALTSWVVLKAALSGIVVSCLGGWMACRHEWSTANAGRPSALWSWIGALVLMGLLVMGVALPASGLFGGFAAVLAVSLLAVFCVRPLLEHLRATGVRLRGALLVRIGLREVTWYPRDLSIAVGALALAIGTSMGVGLMVESFREDFSSMLDQRLAHDVFIDGAGADLHAVAAWLARQPGTPRVQAYGSSRARLHGYPIVLGYTDFSAREAARYGMARGLGLDEALISERTAARLALGVDDVVAVKGRTLRIVAVFRGFGDVGLRLLVDSATAERMGVAPLYDRLSVSGDALSGLDDRLLERFAGTYPGLRVQPRSDMRSLALDIFDRTFAITRALTLLALLVAVIGMYNALLALRLNQAPSYVLLDALGVGIWEQRWIALRRAGAVGALAVVLALPLGIALGWLLCNVINPRAFGWSLSLQLSAAELLIPVGLGLLAAGVAGILPLPREGEGIADGA